jgi:hypothetical protein
MIDSRQVRFCLLPLSLAAFPSMAADPMCSAIQDFAQAQKDSQPHTVELLTQWGGDGDVLAWKKCLDNDYPPGMQLCKFILNNPISMEFPEDNLARALSCISNDQPIRTAPRDVFVELLHVRYSSSSLPGLRKRISVTIELNRDNDGPPSLKITTERIDN